MESDDFPELGPVFEEVCREQLKQELPEALFEQMEQAFTELFQLCQNQEDKTILKRCFSTIRCGGVPLKIPLEAWEPYRVSGEGGEWDTFEGLNNVFSQVPAGGDSDDNTD